MDYRDRTIAHKLSAMQGNDNFNSLEGSRLYAMVKDVLRVFFMKHYPSPVIVHPNGFVEHTNDDDRLIRNFIWNQRKHIFEENDVMGPIIFSILLCCDTQNILTWVEPIPLARVLEQLKNHNYNIPREELRKIDGLLYRFFIKLMYILTHELDIMDYKEVTGTVAKYQLAHYLNGWLMSLEHGLRGNLDELKAGVIQSIKMKTLTNRNIIAAMHIMDHEMSSDNYEASVQKHLNNIRSEAEKTTSSEFLREFPDPNPEEVDSVIASLVID